MGWVPNYVLAVLALWLVWQLAEIFITAPRWAWYTAASVTGVLVQVILRRDYWWLGVGIGGGAAVLVLLTDLAIVVTDLCRVRVLRSAPPGR